MNKFRLDDDPALMELARIVPAVDIASDVDDQQLLARATFVYDALYEHCRRVTAAADPS
ncbi:MAG: hypothetical protein ACM30G_14160 [Micromonosporaceae bacterium]